jgi:hypothetical protein
MFSKENAQAPPADSRATYNTNVIAPLPEAAWLSRFITKS